MDNNNINNDSIDIAGLVRYYIANWKLFAIAMSSALAIAVMYIYIVPPTFEIMANVIIKQEGDSGGNMQSVLAKSFGSGISGGNVDDEIFVIASHTNIRNTVKEIGTYKKFGLKDGLLKREDLYNESPIDVYTPETVLDTLSTDISFKIRVKDTGAIKVKIKAAGEIIGEKESTKFPIIINTSYGCFNIYKTNYFTPDEDINLNITLSGYDVVAEDYEKELESELPNKRTNLINLAIEDKNIQRGKDFLNTLIRLYNKSGLEDKNLEAANTGRFIDDRLAIINKELSDVEYEIEQYKKTHKILSVEGEAQESLSKREAYANIQFQNELSRHALKALEDYLSNDDNKGSIIISTSASIPSLATLGAVISNYNGYVTSKRELLRTAKENSPIIYRINDHINISWNQVKESLKSVKKDLDLSDKDFGEAEQKMDRKVYEAPTKLREFIEIKRQQSIKADLFMFLLQKKEENNITLAANTPKGQIVDMAYNRNKPVSLSKIVILFIGCFLGFLFAGAYLYFRDLLKTKFSTREELEKLTSNPIAGEICISRSDNHIVVKDGVHSSISELFRLVRTNIQFLLSGSNEKVMLVTSSVSGEGKSFISCNIAMSFALTGKKVVLIGMDIRQPKLGDYLNISSSKGITNYLASDTLTEKDIIIKEPFAKGFDVILSGPVPPNPAELLLDTRLETLIENLRREYDYIILDSAPAGMVADTLSLNRISDITLYVCRANYTEKDNIKYANSLAADKKLRKLSYIINATNTKTGYGYGYGKKE